LINCRKPFFVTFFPIWWNLIEIWLIGFPIYILNLNCLKLDLNSFYHSTKRG
jgi:hypothetical protein